MSGSSYVVPRRTKFKFPTKSFSRPLVPLVSLPLAVRKDPKYRRLEPIYDHMGISYSEESWSRGKYKGGWRKTRYPNRARQTAANRGEAYKWTWVRPDDRVRQWTIGPGDQVRLLRGDPEDKYENPEQGKDGGWKTYKVKKIDQHKNRIYLANYRNPSLDPETRPADWDELDGRKKTLWLQNNSAEGTMKPVHYSDVSLLVSPYEPNSDEPATDRIWARRMWSGKAYWDKEQRCWKWPRFAVYRDEHGQNAVKEVEWPTDKPMIPTKGDLDSDQDMAHKVTFVPRSTDELLQYGPIDPLIPDTLRSPPPLAYDAQWVSDRYIQQTKDVYEQDDHSQLVDMLMPLYLGEELSPRFATWKKDLAFQQRQSVFAQQKEEFVQAAVDEWIAGGKDRHLRGVMDTPEAGMQGVPVRPRTKEEVIEAAELEHDEIVARELRDTARHIKKGEKWNYVNERWEATEESARKLRKKRRKAEKAKAKLEGLERKKLEPGRANQYVPLAQRKVDPDQRQITA